MYEEAISFKSLYAAMWKCRRGVSWKDSVARYTADGLKETYRLRQELLSGTYAIRPYQQFTVTDPKEREVKATHLRDRQFQRSLCDSGLYDELTRGFVRDNFACQKDRGMDDAMDRLDVQLHRYYRKYGNTGWVLKCDVKHYFAETRHDVAKAAVRERVRDPCAVKAVEQIIDSFGGEKGIGLGSQISQLIELSVLDKLDHFIKERLRVKTFSRYMDDFILVHPNKDFLQNALRNIRERLAKIGLELNQKTGIFPLKNGINFLKWKFLLTDTGRVVRLISRKSVTRQRRKLRHMKRKRLTAAQAEESTTSWAASAARGCTRKIVSRMWDYFKNLYPRRIAA